MIKPVRTFISYQQSRRCMRTAIEFVATFVVSGLGFAIAALLIVNSPNRPPFVAVAGALVGIVAFIVGCSLLSSFTSKHIHEVQVDDEGVKYDDKTWSWECVISIRSIRALPNGADYLFIGVQRAPFRSPLTLPIEVRGGDPIGAINELRQYLIETGHKIPWQ